MADIKHIILGLGCEEWRLNGELHREDGPAVEYKNGRKEWWRYGAEYTFEEWFKVLEWHLSIEELIAVKLKYG